MMGEKNRKDMLELVKFFGNLPGAGKMVKNAARLMDAQDRIEKALFEVGLRAIDGSLGDDCKMLSDTADYFELVLAGIESFEKSFEKEEK